MTPLEKSILATLVYYDVLDRPLTGWEVFKYLIRFKDINLNEILETLENSSELNKLISQKNGFYYLKNRQVIIKERIKRHKIADKKWKKARRAIKLFQIIPFIRMVAVSGSLAINNTRENSDIDLLIVTKTGRIWTCRWLITIFSHLIGKRRHGILTKDRLCLNHYLTEKSLKIPYKSLYNAQTYAHLTLFWQSKNNLYKRFQKANQWVNEYLTFYPINIKGYLREIKSNIFLKDIRELKEFFLDGMIGNFIELILKKIQRTRIKKDPLTYQSGGRVVFSDNQLEFHPNSPEKWILEKYNQRIKKLGFKELGDEKDSGLIS